MKLCPTAKRLKKALTVEYDIRDAAGLILVDEIAECFTRKQQAQKTLESEGTFVKNRFGEQKEHPAVSVEKNARAHLMQALKQLGVDVELNRDAPGRPPEIGRL